MSRFVFFMLVIMFVVSIATIVVYLYFNELDKREREAEKERREHTEKLVDVADDEYSGSDSRDW